MGRASVLIVDDDVRVGALVVRVLGAAGYDVRSVLSADEALLAIEESLPDVICIDLVLPGMNGAALAREIRERLYDLTPPLMLVSGSVEALEPGEEKLFDAVLAKPFKIDVLRARVRKLAKRGAMKRKRSAQRFAAVDADAAADDDAADG